MSVRRQQWGAPMLIQFPKRHLGPTFSEASATIISAVRPADRAVPVDRIGPHHSAGMLSRCDHLRTAEAEWPISSAIRSGVPHKETTSRKVESDISPSIGHCVLKSKAKVSHDHRGAFDKIPGMDRMSETEEKLAFIRRTKQAREARFTQNEICKLLELDQGTWKQYETRTPLPHRYIPKFCVATGVSADWLLTGDGEGVPEIPRRLEKRTRGRLKGRAA